MGVQVSRSQFKARALEYFRQVEISGAAVDNEIAVRSMELPGEFHQDPADRIIIATARKLAAPLATVDDRIRAYPQLQSIR